MTNASFRHRVTACMRIKPLKPLISATWNQLLRIHYIIEQRSPKYHMCEMEKSTRKLTLRYMYIYTKQKLLQFICRPIFYWYIRRFMSRMPSLFQLDQGGRIEEIFYVIHIRSTYTYFRQQTIILVYIFHWPESHKKKKKKNFLRKHGTVMNFVLSMHAIGINWRHDCYFWSRTLYPWIRKSPQSKEPKFTLSQKKHQWSLWRTLEH